MIGKPASAAWVVDVNVVPAAAELALRMALNNPAPDRMVRRDESSSVACPGWGLLPYKLRPGLHWRETDVCSCILMLIAGGGFDVGAVSVSYPCSSLVVCSTEISFSLSIKSFFWFDDGIDFSWSFWLSRREECCRFIRLSLLDLRRASLLMRPSLLLRLGRSRRLVTDFCVSLFLVLDSLVEVFWSFVVERDDLVLLPSFSPVFDMGSNKGGASSSPSSVNSFLLL